MSLKHFRESVARHVAKRWRIIRGHRSHRGHQEWTCGWKKKWNKLNWSKGWRERGWLRGQIASYLTALSSHGLIFPHVGEISQSPNFSSGIEARGLSIRWLNLKIPFIIQHTFIASIQLLPLCLQTLCWSGKGSPMRVASMKRIDAAECTKTRQPGERSRKKQWGCSTVSEHTWQKTPDEKHSRPFTCAVAALLINIIEICYSFQIASVDAVWGNFDVKINWFFKF